MAKVIGRRPVSLSEWRFGGSGEAGRRRTCRCNYGVVVTGSTKGVGLALAEEFLRSGDDVVVCSRKRDKVEETVERLRDKYPSVRVFGTSCDVSEAEDVKRLCDFAADNLGVVDIWINNAGTNAYSFKPLVETDAGDLKEVVETNTLGLMFCMKEAINLMRSQKRGSDEEVVGHIFNMDGAGTSGSATPRFAAYGATKRAIVQLNKSLQAELEMLNIDNVVLHMLSPGMVTTELLMAGSDTKIAKFMINALAEQPDEVAGYLVPRVRRVVEDAKGGEGEKTGAAGEAATTEPIVFRSDSVVILGQKIKLGDPSSYIKYLTLPMAFSRIFLKALFGIRNNRWIEE